MGVLVGVRVGVAVAVAAEVVLAPAAVPVGAVAAPPPPPPAQLANVKAATMRTAGSLDTRRDISSFLSLVAC